MDDNNNQIFFYGTKQWKEYFFMSNFCPSPITLDDKEWPTTEHYFQAMKFILSSDELVEKVRLSKTAREAANIGRDKNNPKRIDWEFVKEDYMEKALYAKFTQHPKLKKKLLDTGDKILVERTKNDSYWGDGGDGSGKNRLGNLLMKVRTRIRDEMKNFKGEKAEEKKEK